jgi:site-specific recombinase XerD
MAILLRWMEKRRSLGLTGRQPLFCTLQGRPLHASYVRTALHRLGEKAGVEKRVHPHGLRHTLAFELMWEGVPAPVIQRQLGHTSLATTQRYLDHLAPKDLVVTMQSREFRI